MNLAAVVVGFLLGHLLGIALLWGVADLRDARDRARCRAFAATIHARPVPAGWNYASIFRRAS